MQLLICTLYLLFQISFRGGVDNINIIAKIVICQNFEVMHSIVKLEQLVTKTDLKTAVVMVKKILFSSKPCSALLPGGSSEGDSQSWPMRGGRE